MARGKQWVRDANAAAAKRQKTTDEASKEEDEVLVVDAVTGTEAPPPLERTGAEDGLADEEEIEEPTAEQIAAHKFAIEQNFLHAMCSNSPEDMSRFRVRTVGDMMFFMAFQISKCLVPHHNARYAMRGDSTEIKAMDTDLQHIRIMQKSIFAFHFASGKRNDLFQARLVPYMLGILELFWQAMAIKLNGGKYEVCACVCLGAMCACVCLGATCACVVCCLLTRGGRVVRRRRARSTRWRTCARRRALSATSCSCGCSSRTSPDLTSTSGPRSRPLPCARALARALCRAEPCAWPFVNKKLFLDRLCIRVSRREGRP